MSMPWPAATVGQRRGVDRVELRDLGDEALEARRGAGDEHAGAVRADLVGVRDAARREEELAGAQRDRVAGHEQRELAAEDVEALVLVAVHVQRRHLAGGHVHVDEAERAAAGKDASGRAEEVELGGLGDGGHRELQRVGE